MKFGTFALVCISAAVLAGCSSSKNESLCPGAAALVEASSLTGFSGATAGAPSQPLYRVAVSNVTTDCSIDAHERTADSSLEIHFVATRAAGSPSAEYRVPYFVALRQGPAIIAKKVFWATFDFATGETSVTFSESVAATVVKIANDKQPYDYQILTGLQLTPEQLEYNRKAGHYGP